jgi:hypothetical protein
MTSYIIHSHVKYTWHFNDNWIITLYMGHVIDLSLE